jgi:UvrD-like helicase C-terminal domain
VITPPSARAALVAALDADGIAWTPELRPAAAPVVVLTPDDAKGLEFDVVVVVEPQTIVDESEHGLRALYVALTRCTSRLAVVHARSLPAVLGLGGVLEADEVGEAGDDEDGDGVTLDHTPDRPEAAEPVDAPDEVEVPARGYFEVEAEPEPAAGGFDLDEISEDSAPPALAGAFDHHESAGRSGVDHDDSVAPVPEVAATLDALMDLDREIARAIASAVIERLRPLVSPSLLALVAEEIARAVEPADEAVRGR